MNPNISGSVIQVASQWQCILSLIGACGTLVALLTIWLTLNEVRRVRRQQRVDEYRMMLRAVCTSPAARVASYRDLYRSILEYYERDEKWSKCRYFPVGKPYFQESVEKHYPENNVLDLAGQPEEYRFPLIARERWWLRSQCEGDLSIDSHDVLDTESLDGTVVCEDPHRDGGSSDNKLRIAARKFLDRLQIEDYPAFLGLSGKRIWNDAAFEICGIEEQKCLVKLKLKFRLGCYYNFVNSYDLVGKELYFREYAHRRGLNDNWLARLMPDRWSLRRAVPSGEIFDFHTRPAKLGINVFVLMKKPEVAWKPCKYCTFVQKRGEDQVEYPGVYHVVPAGTFQPLSDFDTKTIKRQYSFSYTVIRELLEEVYDLEKADRNRATDPFQILRLEIERAGAKVIPGELLGLLGEGGHCDVPPRNAKYEIIPTGFFVDLLTLKPELTVVLHIKDPNVYQQSKDDVHGNWEGAVKEFDVESEDFLGFLRRNLHVGSFLPAGAVALAEGINYYFSKLRK